MLTDRQRALWNAYLAEEARAPRGERLRALDSFLQVLVESSPEDWFPWALSVAEGVVDGGDDLIIRQPLFRRAVFPALLAGLRDRVPGCARWLAGLAPQLYRCKDCVRELPEAERSEVGLLRAAVRHEPSDRASRRRLIAALADRLRSSLHELPSGVLFGMDGATVEECGWLLEELEEFQAQVDHEGCAEEYQDLIRDCRLHFHTYRLYLTDRDGARSYAEYLSRRSRA
jgi:hypothetical protein